MVLFEKSKKITFFIILILFSSFVLSLKNFDLSDYPEPFVVNSSFNTLIIVGENSKAGDTIGAVEIATSLGAAVNQDIVVLDTNIDSVKKTNAIVVGGPCVNIAAAELLGFPHVCDDGFEPGKAKIKLFQGLEGQRENVALLVAGYSVMDTKIACSVLSHYEDYSFDGKEIETAGSVLNDITLNLVD